MKRGTKKITKSKELKIAEQRKGQTWKEGS
jgi:hypothetical protein